MHNYSYQLAVPVYLSRLCAKNEREVGARGVSTRKASNDVSYSFGQEVEVRAANDTSELERQFLFAQKRMQTWWRRRNIALQLTTEGVPDERFFSVYFCCLLYTSPSPRDVEESRMPSSA